MTHEGLFFKSLFDEDGNGTTAIACVGNHVVVGGECGLIKSWKRGCWSSPGEKLLGHTGEISSLASARGGKLLVSSCFDKTIRVWKIVNSECLNFFNDKRPAFYMCPLENRDAIAIECYSHAWGNDVPSIILIGLESGDVLRKIETRNRAIFTAMQAHECRVVCVYNNVDIEVWDLEEDPECIRLLRFDCRNQKRNAWIKKSKLIVLDERGKLSEYDFLEGL